MLFYYRATKGVKLDCYAYFSHHSLEILKTMTWLLTYKL